jgi:predicted DNA-binding transcriptional regulator YafY
VSESARLYRYQSLLSTRRAVPTREFLSTLEISLATFKRDIAKMRDEMGMPIVFDHERGGYVLRGDPATNLPGLWITPQELVALATLQQLLVQLQPGLVETTLAPIRQRLADLLQAQELSDREAGGRVLIVHVGKRVLAPQALEAVASATLRRRRLAITHVNRQTQERVQREVSPQRLVLYRDHWFLDAWCHLRNAPRSFSVDAIESQQVMEAAAYDMPAVEIDAVVYPSYGIFAGTPKGRAVLRFSPERAHWVAGEQWHPQQEGRTLDDGSYELTVPYGDDRELVGDILRHGPFVDVVSPPELRARVHERLLQATARYAGAQPG